MTELVTSHPVTSVIVAFAVFNAMVQAMEKPTEKDGRLYRYVFRLGHGLCFNFQYALKAKFPEYIPQEDKAAQ